MLRIPGMAFELDAFVCPYFRTFASGIPAMLDCAA
ncbi:hypothetical protein PIN31115_00682 [Pandoraea iniqua]|uniref:Uncharacterized protein n=1 Tax=Pandoraea iniqua TaxID=2508288 RepID=A0A5E4SBQ5_9BURK|nr:hypothetical protein PIN31115_00682 [Pandoraea iniqua]